MESDMAFIETEKTAFLISERNIGNYNVSVETTISNQICRLAVVEIHYLESSSDFLPLATLWKGIFVTKWETLRNSSTQTFLTRDYS